LPGLQRTNILNYDINQKTPRSLCYRTRARRFLLWPAPQANQRKLIIPDHRSPVSNADVHPKSRESECARDPRAIDTSAEYYRCR
ncbi:hypothetical protein, partial [Bradyrhizobium sp. NFR13]|uniref:hypothetical protein n=1 Tax=Bradyrhizobium sp. NFR13 TaxID=1566285 RepID=UPI001AECE436